MQSLTGRRQPQLKKGEPKLSISQRGKKLITLLGTYPNKYYIRLPRASIVRPDFHYLAVLDPNVRTYTDKIGHPYFSLKYHACGKCTFLCHKVIN